MPEEQAKNEEAVQPIDKDPTELSTREILGYEDEGDDEPEETEEEAAEAEEADEAAEETEEEDGDDDFEYEEQGEDTEASDPLGLEDIGQIQDESLRGRVARAYEDSKRFGEWNAALANEQTAGPALNSLIEYVAKGLGTTREELLGLSVPDKEAPKTPTGNIPRQLLNEEGDDFAYETDKAMYTEVVQPLQSELAALKGELAEIRQERERAKAEAESKAFAQKALSDVQKRVNSRYPGFEVTEEMLANAVQAFPQYKDKPAKAVEAAYTEQIIRSQVASKRTKAPKGPEMMQSSVTRGGPKIDPDMDLRSLAHALHQRNTLKG
jgi:hypothetical protein